MKDTFYFSHDYNARNDLKIQALISDHGPAGYGIFWAISEVLHEEEGHLIHIDNVTIKALAKQMSTSVEQINLVLKSCVEIGLFHENSDGIFSKRVNENIKQREEISKKRSKAGRISAKSRHNSTSVEHVLTSVEQNPTKERKGKENKEEEIILSRARTFAEHTEYGNWKGNEGTLEFLLKTYPVMMSLEKPITYVEYDRLCQKYGKKLVKDTFRDMEAWSKLDTKRWAAGVADKWAESEQLKQKT